MTISVREHLLRAGDAMVLLDTAGAATYATPRARELLGADRTEEVTLDRIERAGRHGALDLRADASTIESRRVRELCAPDGSVLDVVALATDTDALAVFVAPTEVRSPADAPSRTAISMLEKVLATTRDAVLVTTAEPFGEPCRGNQRSGRDFGHHVFSSGVGTGEGGASSQSGTGSFFARRNSGLNSLLA